MNRTGDMIVNLYSKDIWRKQNKYGTRTVFPSDSKKVFDFVKTEFPEEKGWLLEIDHALHENKCIISVIDHKTIRLLGLLVLIVLGKATLVHLA